MILVLPYPEWKQGRYLVTASSSTAKLEWYAFAKRHPEAAQKAWERLSNNPLDRQPRKQYPLRGSAFYPFWELEATRGERIFYAVDEIGLITIIAARDDIHTAPQLAKMLGARRSAYREAVAEVLRVAIRGQVDEPLKVPAWALKPR